MQVFIFIIVAIVIIAIIAIVLSKEQEKKQTDFLKSKGVDVTKMVDIGTYISGHPEINDQITNISLYKEKEDLVIYQRYGDTCNVRGFIPIANIKDIFVEDQSSFEKRITLGRVLLVGVFALAWQKKKKNELYFIVITWHDGKFDHETIFQVNGLDLPNRSNAIRNKLIQECR